MDLWIFYKNFLFLVYVIFLLSRFGECSLTTKLFTPSTELIHFLENVNIVNHILEEFEHITSLRHQKYFNKTNTKIKDDFTYINPIDMQDKRLNKIKLEKPTKLEKYIKSFDPKYYLNTKSHKHHRIRNGLRNNHVTKDNDLYQRSKNSKKIRYNTKQIPKDRLFNRRRFNKYDKNIDYYEFIPKNRAKIFRKKINLNNNLKKEPQRFRNFLIPDQNPNLYESSGRHIDDILLEAALEKRPPNMIMEKIRNLYEKTVHGLNEKTLQNNTTQEQSQKNWTDIENDDLLKNENNLRSNSEFINDNYQNENDIFPQFPAKIDNILKTVQIQQMKKQFLNNKRFESNREYNDPNNYFHHDSNEYNTGRHLMSIANVISKNISKTYRINNSSMRMIPIHPNSSVVSIHTSILKNFTIKLKPPDAYNKSLEPNYRANNSSKLNEILKFKTIEKRNVKNLDFNEGDSQIKNFPQKSVYITDKKFKIFGNPVLHQKLTNSITYQHQKPYNSFRNRRSRKKPSYYFENLYENNINPQSKIFRRKRKDKRKSRGAKYVTSLWNIPPDYNGNFPQYNYFKTNFDVNNVGNANDNQITSKLHTLTSKLPLKKKLIIDSKIPKTDQFIKAFNNLKIQSIRNSDEDNTMDDMMSGKLANNILKQVNDNACQSKIFPFSQELCNKTKIMEITTQPMGKANVDKYLQKIIELIYAIINKEIYERNCIMLPKDLEQFLRKILAAKTFSNIEPEKNPSDPIPPNKAYESKEYLFSKIFNDTSSCTEKQGISKVRNSTNLLEKCEKLIDKMNTLLYQYEQLQPDEKLQMKSVHDYFHQQLQIVQQWRINELNHLHRRFIIVDDDKNKDQKNINNDKN